LRRPAEPVPGGAVSLPSRRAGRFARRFARDRHGAGRRDHGDRAPPVSSPGTAIPPRIRAHRIRLRTPRSLPARRCFPPRHASGAGRRRATAARRRARAVPSAGPAGPMIIESILTTMDPRGTVNFAPMGVEWGDEEIVIKPFLETTTFHNLQATRAAVVNLTDDVMLFAQGATATAQFPAAPAQVVRGVVIDAVCSWREVQVQSLDATPPRARVVTRVVHRG